MTAVQFVRCVELAGQASHWVLVVPKSPRCPTGQESTASLHQHASLSPEVLCRPSCTNMRPATAATSSPRACVSWRPQRGWVERQSTTSSWRGWARLPSAASGGLSLSWSLGRPQKAKVNYPGLGICCLLAQYAVTGVGNTVVSSMQLVKVLMGPQGGPLLRAGVQLHMLLCSRLGRIALSSI